jgi:hypothetical protein
MSSNYRKTEANRVLETFAELYLEAKGLDDHSTEELDLPDHIETYDGWEYDSDEFWEYKSEVTDQIDELAGDIDA